MTFKISILTVWTYPTMWVVLQTLSNICRSEWSTSVAVDKINQSFHDHTTKAIISLREKSGLLLSEWLQKNDIKMVDDHPETTPGCLCDEKHIFSSPHSHYFCHFCSIFPLSSLLPSSILHASSFISSLPIMAIVLRFPSPSSIDLLNGNLFNYCRGGRKC